MEYLRKYAFINLKKELQTAIILTALIIINGSIKETWNLTDLSNIRRIYVESFSFFSLLPYHI